MAISSHTTIYNNEWEGRGNEDDYFYDIDTFEIDEIDLCENFNNNDKFRKKINENVLCDGRWCVDDIFSCKDTTECYHVEHIIDKRAYPDECVNIAGNLIMAYSKWNQGLGGMSLEDSISEKKEIYDSIYEKALLSIRLCNPQKCDTQPYEHEYSLQTLILVSIFSTIILILCIIFIKYCCKKKNVSYKGLTAEQTL